MVVILRFILPSIILVLLFFDLLWEQGATSQIRVSVLSFVGMMFFFSGEPYTLCVSDRIDTSVEEYIKKLVQTDYYTYILYFVLDIPQSYVRMP